VDVDEPPAAEPAVPEPEVERGADDADDVCLLERCAPGVAEQELVSRWQRSPAGAVEENREASVLRRRGELGGRSVPPDAASGHHHRALRLVQERRRLRELARIPERAG
jgi:hypothetical protein